MSIIRFLVSKSVQKFNGKSSDAEMRIGLNHAKMPQMSVFTKIRTKTKRLMNKVALVVLSQIFT